jgi:pSer/pThr/pTyr-binding forkhead associated (FHA) protein
MPKEGLFRVNSAGSDRITEAIMSSNDNTLTSEKPNNKPNSFLLKRGVLIILSSNFIGKSFIIDKPKIVIGRLENCDFIINDPLVSKEHCEITTDDEGKFFINDLGSKNSTFLNDKRLKKAAHLIYGDRIIIGNTIIRFYLEEKLES